MIVSRSKVSKFRIITIQLWCDPIILKTRTIVFAGLFKDPVCYNDGMLKWGQFYDPVILCLEPATTFNSTIETSAAR